MFTAGAPRALHDGGLSANRSVQCREQVSDLTPIARGRIDPGLSSLRVRLLPPHPFPPSGKVSPLGF